MRVTIKDVAKEAGVSIATVSRVINDSGYVSDPIKKKVLQKIEQLDYQVNAVAKSLKQEKTNMIGVIIPDISNPYFMQISKGVEDEIERYGYNLIFSSSNEDEKKEAKLLELMNEKRVDAIILATTGKNKEQIERLASTGTPIILIDRFNEEIKHRISTITEDNQLGAYKLTKHFIDQGHTNIGVINGSLDVNTGRDRYKGFLQAVEEHDVSVEDSFIYNGDFTEKCGYEAVQHFSSQKNVPTAIIAFNNLMAAGAIKGLTESRNLPLDQVKIGCYGEIEFMVLMQTLNVVYIKQNSYQMGKDTGKVLISHLNKDRHAPHTIMYEPELIV
ncbi:LacI family DNA-binding transcriptional regulator [Virgibacillus sp. W0430]|uniref:LacI family DNA-binding transcriptional regulator n=1 Tax=Virgibacillus sp. W0430 TaxID=3391580 RepID=UPI003F47A29C